MELTLTKPKRDPEDPHSSIDTYRMSYLFMHWMMFNGISIGEPEFQAKEGNFRLAYNSVWEHYDVTLFMLKGNRNSKGHWVKAETFLKEQGYRVGVRYSFRWVRDKNGPSVDEETCLLTIYPKELVTLLQTCLIEAY